MNTNQLKKFAQDARRKLLAQVGARLEYVQTAQSAELLERSAQIAKLKEALLHTKPELLIEKVAYTWFNRLVALRFLDANDYQPLGLSVVSPQVGHTLPQLLAAAKLGQLPEDLRVDRNRLNDLFDGRLPAANPQNEAYRLLLTAACNHLHETFPFLFERIDDYSELLLPEDMTSEFSIVHDVVKGMPAEDCQAVEIIGWLYQFYISERREAVYASGEKYKTEDIPAVTQFFTPRWIVEYLVQNSLGKLWLNSRPKSRLQKHMSYYIPSGEGYTGSRVERPEDIRLLDPACGSGHILVYAFDLLTRIYEEEGYDPSEIPTLILQHNLCGLEIDERAAQLAGLALLLKARQYHRRAFRRELRPKITWLKPLALNDTEIRNGLEDLNLPGFAPLMGDLRLLQQADTFGSLIRPQSSPTQLENACVELERRGAAVNLFAGSVQDQLKEALDTLVALKRQHNCVVANPPYLDNSNMNKTLSDWVKKNYPNSKADLMACFMERGLEWLPEQGFLGMINQHSWMFLSSYEDLRNKLLEDIAIDTMLHLGPKTFPEITGEKVQNTAFVILNTNKQKEGIYIRLVDFRTSEEKRTQALEAIKNPACGLLFTASQQDFAKIPGSPVGYWLTKEVFDIFESFDTLGRFADPRQGMSTTDNLRFLRYWFEIDINKIYLNGNHLKYKWFLYNKGGEYRKYYGNILNVVNYEKGGNTLIELVKKKYPKISDPEFVIKNRKYYFREGLTWTDLTSGKLSVRYLPKNCIFDAAGPTAYASDDDLYYIIGLLNSKTINEFTKILNPTFHFTLSDFQNLPFKKDEAYKKQIEDHVIELIDIFKNEWDSRELSFGFSRNPILVEKVDNEFASTLDYYKSYWGIKMMAAHMLQESINYNTNLTYGLSGKFNFYESTTDISILQENLTKDTLINLNKQIKRDSRGIINSYSINTFPLNLNSVIQDFLSYFTGCLFGRYSLDREGLILANQGETLQNYLEKVGKAAAEVQFLPDADNIVPVLDDTWFEDDIVGRFHAFLRVTFGEKNFAKNLAFVEECLGKDVRTYFVRDFYNDHIKRYKKRPIYWMFSSPGGAFNALVYLHRYTPDTLNQLLNRYLRAFREKLRTRREHLEQLQATGSPAERTKALREKEKIDRDLLDLLAYERDILFPLATERIALDLDDGVLVNYNKLGRAVKEVPGLNDKKAKAKVRGFDWIDTSTIKD